MILLGLDNPAKDAAIADYCRAHTITKVFILSPGRFPLSCSVAGAETIEWADLIEYRFYYRLLREIDKHTLVVVNECLRTTNRHSLTYNCIRLFLNQTPHKLILQYLPLIESIEDFMILVDLETRSRWKRERFAAERLAECECVVHAVPMAFTAVPVPTSAKTKADYAKAKRNLIDGIGLKDPHTIPRNLHLLSGKSKLPCVDPRRDYVGRNNRFGLANLKTYKDDDPAADSIVFEFPHAFGDFIDFAALSRQTAFSVLAADLKVDQWYFQRYQEWAGRLADAYAILS